MPSKKKISLPRIVTSFPPPIHPLFAPRPLRAEDSSDPSFDQPPALPARNPLRLAIDTTNASLIDTSHIATPLVQRPGPRRLEPQSLLDTAHIATPHVQHPVSQPAHIATPLTPHPSLPLPLPLARPPLPPRSPLRALSPTSLASYKAHMSNPRRRPLAPELRQTLLRSIELTPPDAEMEGKPELRARVELDWEEVYLWAEGVWRLRRREVGWECWGLVVGGEGRWGREWDDGKWGKVKDGEGEGEEGQGEKNAV